MKPVFRCSSFLALSLVLSAPVLAQNTATLAARAESLSESIRKGDLAAVKTAIEGEPKLIESTSRGNNPLYVAIQSGKADVVNYLLEKGADPNVETYSGSALAAAVSGWGDNWKTIAEALLAKGAKIDGVDEEGQTPLLRMLNYGGGSAQKDRVSWLLANGADLYARSRDGRNVIQMAIVNSQPDVVTAILEKADVKKADENGNTPLFAAASRGNAEYVRLLLGRGADVNVQNASGDTVLHLAAQYPNALLKILLDAGAKTNLKNNRGDLPLHIALRRRDDSMENRISYSYGGYTEYRQPQSDESAVPRGTLIAPLTAKSDINAKDRFGLSPLLLAIEARDQESRDLIIERAPKMDSTTQLFDAAAQGNLAILKDLLLKKPFLTYFRLADGTTPLHVSALWGTLGAAQLLAQKGADVNARDSRGEAPLHETLARPTGLFARRAKNMEAFLLEKGANADALDANDTSPLFRAVKSGDMELIAPLIAKGVNVNARDKSGQTPIFALMAKESDLKIVALLIDKGASLNLRPPSGASLLSRAVQTQRTDLVQLLLDKGADAKAKDSEGRSPLGALLYSGGNGEGGADIAALLLAKGADPNEKVYGDTLLSRAISNDSKDIVSLLLATKKVSLKSSGEGRQSPLMQAVNYGRVEIVKMLVEAGADASETDDKGRTIAQIGAERSKEMGEAFKTKAAPAA
ncbi:Ankyrin repeat [Abditibacterium utsteinense]|uniref:Ankyrin repeat n=1 Tax=Abditibacterium utsteinense TaxID=1960156 RepID=A0A2S8SUK8_9BACT|nr:ankyrin repeat domain-containing protein [Abditibacterium utsteinense]PQV64478.1 Ankyrin repeat [Abditibacterium utsteinense]